MLWSIQKHLISGIIAPLKIGRRHRITSGVNNRLIVAPTATSISITSWPMNLLSPLIILQERPLSFATLIYVTALGTLLSLISVGSSKKGFAHPNYTWAVSVGWQ